MNIKRMKINKQSRQSINHRKRTQECRRIYYRRRGTDSGPPERSRDRCDAKRPPSAGVTSRLDRALAGRYNSAPGCKSPPVESTRACRTPPRIHCYPKRKNSSHVNSVYPRQAQTTGRPRVHVLEWQGVRHVAVGRASHRPTVAERPSGMLFVLPHPVANRKHNNLCHTVKISHLT